MEVVRVEINGGYYDRYTVDFETAKKIAEAIAEHLNAEIKAWWDCSDGSHYPDVLETESGDVNEIREKWEKTLKKLNVELVIEVDDTYLFYC